MKVILDNIRSALNVGSIFRSADAFDVHELVLCGITASPPSREVHKTALGAELTVPFIYYNSTIAAIEAFKADGYTIIAIEQTPNSVMLHDFSPHTPHQCAYVLGNEVDGVSDEVLALCDTVVEIPQWGSKKSLNVAVAGGIVMWHHASKTKSNI